MNTETRPVLFLTYSWSPARRPRLPDTATADVADVSGSLEEARADKYLSGQPCYRVERLPDGSYGNETFMEWLP